MEISIVTCFKNTISTDKEVPQWLYSEKRLQVIRETVDRQEE